MRGHFSYYCLYLNAIGVKERNLISHWIKHFASSGLPVLICPKQVQVWRVLLVVYAVFSRSTVDYVV